MNELLALLSGDHHLFQGHLSQGRTAGQDGDQGGKGQPRTGRVESCLTLHSVFSLIVMRRSRAEHPPLPTTSDRKSTRLNSSHVAISYAVFCLNKKIILLLYYNRIIVIY